MHKVVITDFINDKLATEREALAGLATVSYTHLTLPTIYSV